MKRRWNFRLSEAACLVIVRFAAEKHMNATEVVELALQILDREGVQANITKFAEKRVVRPPVKAGSIPREKVREAVKTVKELTRQDRLDQFSRGMQRKK